MKSINFYINLVLKPSKSLYKSLLLLIQKKRQTVIGVDFQKLNEKVIVDQFPLNRLEVVSDRQKDFFRPD